MGNAAVPVIRGGRALFRDASNLRSGRQARNASGREHLTTHGSASAETDAPLDTRGSPHDRASSDSLGYTATISKPDSQARRQDAQRWYRRRSQDRGKQSAPRSR